MNISQQVELHNLGGELKRHGQLVEAEKLLRAALTMSPRDAKTRHALGIVLLSQGKYNEGWSLYDARHEIEELRNPKPRLQYPEWKGEPLTGKRLLIFPEQGFGDQIMFARFAHLANDIGASVTIICWPSLARLFQSLPGIEVIPAMGNVEFSEPDYWVMFSSLAGRFGVTLDELPNAPYLRARPRLVEGRVGVAWRGNPSHQNDANRSLPPELGDRLLAAHGAVSLDPSKTGAKDFQDTAEIIAGLDLVISVDTAVAHLAGAMGKPVWILIPSHMTDWRWLQDREDSPWYPTARLYWQEPGGAWESVISRIERDLSSFSPSQEE